MSFTEDGHTVKRGEIQDINGRTVVSQVMVT